MTPPKVDWSRAPLLAGALVAFVVAAWLYREAGGGELAAATLVVIGSILVGAFIADWSRRGGGDDEH